MELSLKSLVKKTMKLELTDGSVINILPPSKDLYEKHKTATDKELYEQVTDILNNNSEKKIFELSDVENMFDYDEAMYIFKGFTQFINEITLSKN